MTRLGSEATIIRLRAFIFLCRTSPWVKYPRNSEGTTLKSLKETLSDLNRNRDITKNISRGAAKCDSIINTTVTKTLWQSEYKDTYHYWKCNCRKHPNGYHYQN